MLDLWKSTVLWRWLCSWFPGDVTAWFVVPLELLPFFIGALLACVCERRTVRRAALVSLFVYLLFEGLYLLWQETWWYYSYLVGMTALKLLMGIGVFKALRFFWKKARGKAAETRRPET
ncbi:MAG: hypothetical protein ACI4PC_05220 [Oscillospiraceae bacterium]